MNSLLAHQVQRQQNDTVFVTTVLDSPSGTEKGAKPKPKYSDYKWELSTTNLDTEGRKADFASPFWRFQSMALNCKWAEVEGIISKVKYDNSCLSHESSPMFLGIVYSLLSQSPESDTGSGNKVSGEVDILLRPFPSSYHVYMRNASGMKHQLQHSFVLLSSPWSLPAQNPKKTVLSL